MPRPALALIVVLLAGMAAFSPAASALACVPAGDDGPDTQNPAQLVAPGSEDLSGYFRLTAELEGQVVISTAGSGATPVESAYDETAANVLLALLALAAPIFAATSIAAYVFQRRRR